jgi:hypothetical protein
VVSEHGQAVDAVGMKTRNVVLSALVLIWGAAVLVVGALGGSTPHGGSAYNTGRAAAYVFAGLLILAGARGLWIERKRAHSTAP